MPPFPEPEVEIILADDEPAAGEWTPARGIARGAIATVIVGAILSGAWCLLAWKRPDVVVAYSHEDVSVTFIMGAIGGMMAFFMCWILFAAMHRFAQTVGFPCTVIVVVVALLGVLAKQLTVAATGGVDTLDGEMVVGASWLEPSRFVTSNTGVWAGIVFAVYAFREGDSITEFFQSS